MIAGRKPMTFRNSEVSQPRCHRFQYKNVLGQSTIEVFQSLKRFFIHLPTSTFSGSWISFMFTDRRAPRLQLIMSALVTLLCSKTKALDFQLCKKIQKKGSSIYPSRNFTVGPILYCSWQEMGVEMEIKSLFMFIHCHKGYGLQWNDHRSCRQRNIIFHFYSAISGM